MDCEQLKQLDIKFIDPGTDPSGEQVDLNEVLSLMQQRHFGGFQWFLLQSMVF